MLFDPTGKSERCGYPMGRLADRQENLEFLRRELNGAVK
jgi:hypothetical protein